MVMMINSLIADQGLYYNVDLMATVLGENKKE